MAETNNVRVTADPVSNVAASVADISKAVFGYLGKGEDVKIAQKKVDNTKVLLEIEQEKGETAEALAQIALLSKRLDIELAALSNAKAHEKSQNITILMVLVFFALVLFIFLRYTRPEPEPQVSEQPQIVILQE